MSPVLIPISPTTRTTLLELVARTGLTDAELIAVAVEEFRQRLSTSPIAEIPGVIPADVWEANAQAEAGRLIPHEDVFAKLRGRE